jgi:hypothetical protein
MYALKQALLLVPRSVLFFTIAMAPSHAADLTGGLSDKNLAAIICFASRENYSQNERWCGYLDDTAKDGSLCSRKSANSRTGHPCCNVNEVTQKQINRYRATFGRRT